MAAYSLINHYQEGYNQLHAKLKQFKKHSGNKALHDYRVAGKQLDALHYWVLTFCTVSEADKMAKWFDQFKEFYKASGKARNCHILLKTGKQLNIWDDLPNILTPLLVKHKKRMHKLAVLSRRFRIPPGQIVKRSLKKCEQRISKVQLPQMLHQFVYTRLNEAYQTLCQPVSDRWHFARMQIKASYYLMKDVNTIGRSLFDNELVKLCESLEQDLGQWHDLEMFSQFVIKKQCISADIDAKLQLAMNDVVEVIESKVPHLKQLCQFGEFNVE